MQNCIVEREYKLRSERCPHFLRELHPNIPNRKCLTLQNDTTSSPKTKCIRQFTISGTKTLLPCRKSSICLVLIRNFERSLKTTRNVGAGVTALETKNLLVTARCLKSKIPNTTASSAKPRWEKYYHLTANLKDALAAGYCFKHS